VCGVLLFESLLDATAEAEDLAARRLSFSLFPKPRTACAAVTSTPNPTQKRRSLGQGWWVASAVDQ